MTHVLSVIQTTADHPADAVRGRATDAGRTTSLWSRLGPPVFGVAVAALGVQHLLTGDFPHGLAPVPARLPGRVALAYLTGAVLLVAGGSVVAATRVRVAAAGLGTVFALWFALLQLPALLAHPGNGSLWTVAFETAAIGGAAWMLAAHAAPGSPLRDDDGPWARAALVGRVAFGVALVVFGILHLVYHGVVASLVPAWIPAHLFWAYATGVAHLAAGLGILTGLGRRLGGVLVGWMFGLWVLIVHAPRVAATPGVGPEWTSLLIALAMCGASWIAARPGGADERSPGRGVGRLAPRPRPAPARRSDAGGAVGGRG